MKQNNHIQKARKRLHRRYEREKAENQALCRQARKDFESILQMIIHEFKPVRVYQWGSLLYPENFRVYSDIDIAVEGISSAGTYFDLLGKAQDMTSFPVDIVQVEKIRPEFFEDIRENGKIVYENDG